MAVIETFTCLSAEALRKLQGRNCLLPQKYSSLEILILNVFENIGCSGPLRPLTLDRLDAASNIGTGKSAESLCKFNVFITGLYSWALNQME